MFEVPTTGQPITGEPGSPIWRLPEAPRATRGHDGPRTARRACERIWLIIAVAVFVGGIVLAANVYDHQVNGPNPECVGLSQVHINDPQSPQEQPAPLRSSGDSRTAGPWGCRGLSEASSSRWAATPYRARHSRPDRGGISPALPRGCRGWRGRARPADAAPRRGSGRRGRGAAGALTARWAAMQRRADRATGAAPRARAQRGAAVLARCHRWCRRHAFRVPEIFPPAGASARGRSPLGPPEP